VNRSGPRHTGGCLGCSCPKADTWPM